MEEDKRREAAIAATPALRPNFKSASVSQDQLSKFKELHRRRLQIKSRSKKQKNSKVNKCGGVETHAKEFSSKASKDGDTSIFYEDSNVSTSKENHSKDPYSLLQDKTPASLASSKKRQKLHWGLDTKERWERKANM